MKYRPFGQLGFQVSALGFGAMRFPTKDGEIDEVEATEMLRYALDHGVNYFDTAYNYHGGKSESFLGRFIKDCGCRDKITLVTKLPSWLVNEPSDFDKYLNEQLERLQVDYLDFYLLHSINKKSWIKLRDLGVREWAEKAIASGRFRHLGFSFHGEYEEFEQIVNEYDWKMCLVQYNYMDVNNQAGVKGVKYAASRGMAIAVMEPLLGGKLAKAPDSVQAIWDTAKRKLSPVGWALNWLWNQPEISVVLSGMSTLEQVKQNVAFASASEVGSLSEDELALFEKVRQAYNDLAPVPCTRCRYCVPCPQGVDIPRNFSIYNQALMYNDIGSAKWQYGEWKRSHERNPSRPDIRAAQCVQCEACEEKCPQSIPISKWMPVVHKALGEDGPLVRVLDE